MLAITMYDFLVLFIMIYFSKVADSLFVIIVFNYYIMFLSIILSLLLWALCSGVLLVSRQVTNTKYLI